MKIFIAVFTLIILFCSQGFGEDILYPDLTLPGPLPFEEPVIEPSPDDIITRVNPGTVDLLIALLNEKDPAVRSQAAWALGDIGEQKIQELNKKIVVSLKNALKDTDPDVRATLTGALAKLGGEAAVTAIAALLKDEDARVRREAGRALIKLKPETAVNNLIDALNDPDFLVRKYSVLALGAVASEDAIEPLKKISDSALMPDTISAMTKIGKRDAVPYIVSALSNTEPSVRAEACISLGVLKASDSRDSLIASLKDSHFYVRRSAVMAIGEIYLNEEEVISKMEGTVPDLRSEARRIGTVPGSTVIHELLLMLEDKDASVRIQTCLTLAGMKAESAFPSLVKRLSDEDEFVRRSAAKAIADIGGSAIDVLMEGIDAQDILTRRESAWGLGYIASSGTKPSVPSLLPCLKDKDLLLRRNTSWALGKIKDAVSVDALLESISDIDTEVRRNSACALGEIDNQKAVPGLIEHLSDEERVVRAESARSLGKIADISALEPLLGAIARVEKEHSSIRRESAWALGELKDQKAVPALIRVVTEKTIPTQMGPVYDDTQVRIQAVIALGKIGAPETVEPLEKCLTNEKESPPVMLRRVLSDVLTKLTGKEYPFQKDFREKTYFITPITDFKSGMEGVLTSVNRYDIKLRGE